MRKQQAIDIDAMVSRFLCWKLPKDFAPDGRIKFDRVFLVFDGFDGGQSIDISDAPDHYWPTGTNLFTAEQAKAMIEHMLGIVPTNDGNKLPPSEPSKPAPPPEQECEHRKITYCHGSSLWICADCDEGFSAGEFMGLQLIPPVEGMTSGCMHGYVTHECFYRAEDCIDTPYCPYCRNALLEKIMEDALASFSCTQRPEDYPRDHWSNRAAGYLEDKR